jgi:hypothetical protein
MPIMLFLKKIEKKSKKVKILVDRLLKVVYIINIRLKNLRGMKKNVPAVDDVLARL